MGPAEDPSHPEPASGALAFSREELRAQYLSYRRRQARGLLGLLPQEAVRPLYRRALADVAKSEGGDPMEILVTYCEALLPLPPFPVWLDDLHAAPDAHWTALEASADTPSPSKPATMDLRRLGSGAGSWTARLRGFRDGDVWRGFIAFEDEAAADGVHRTALIFREATVSDLRDRFRSFESASLEAFLRSALP